MPTMITIKGREVSEDTIALALMQYFTEHPEKYIFQAGDVVKNMYENKRVIFKNAAGHLRSIALETNEEVATVGQKDFEKFGYRKIGVLSDYIK